MDNDQLAALDRAATWLRECSAWLLSADLDMQCPMKADPLDIAEDLEALTGKLVLIDDGAVERVVEEMRKVTLWYGTPLFSDVQLTEDEQRALATAALSALGVK